MFHSGSITSSYSKRFIKCSYSFTPFEQFPQAFMSIKMGCYAHIFFYKNLLAIVIIRNNLIFIRFFFLFHVFILALHFCFNCFLSIFESRFFFFLLINHLCQIYIKGAYTIALSSLKHLPKTTFVPINIISYKLVFPSEYQLPMRIERRCFFMFKSKVFCISF